MPEEPKTQFKHGVDKDSAIESHRALLRRALQKNPEDERLHNTLKELLAPYYVRRAAKKGVFIGYARDDELFAFDLTTQLRNAGIKAFMDEMDVSNDDDSEWGNEVVHALRQCGAMILILSPHSLYDAEVQGERIYFLKHGKVVIPVVAETCNTNGLEMAIMPLDFQKDPDASLKTLIDLLQKPEPAAKE